MVMPRARSFGRGVDLIVAFDFAAVLVGHDLGQCRRERRLAMIHMTYRTHIHMRLRPLKFLFGHRITSFKRLNYFCQFEPS